MNLRTTTLGRTGISATAATQTTLKSSPVPARDATRRWVSPRTFFGALFILIAVPVTVLSQLVWADGQESMIHWSLALGFAFLAAGVFDFTASAWPTRIGSAGMALLTAIFVVQGISETVPGATLHRVAFEILGQGLETAAMYAFFAWCFVLLFSKSHGKTRAYGLLVMTAIAGVEIAGLLAPLTGGEAPESLKLVSLLGCTWLLLEGRKATSS